MYEGMYFPCRNYLLLTFPKKFTVAKNDTSVFNRFPSALLYCNVTINFKPNWSVYKWIVISESNIRIDDYRSALFNDGLVEF